MSEDDGAQVTPTRTRSVRERLVDAALEALDELDTTTLLEGIGVREIARRSGASTSSIYHHFGSLAGLAEAVLTHVYASGSQGETAFVPDSAATERVTLDAGYRQHREALEGLVADPEFPLRVGLWALGGQPVADRYGEYIRTLEARLVNLPGLVFGSGAREPRPPFDKASNVAAFGALLHGTALRQIVDPDPARLEQFPRAAIALSSITQRIVGDRHTVDARLAEINHFPVDQRQAARSTPRSAVARGRILDAARALFESVGFEEATLEQVAQRAEVGLSTLHGLFPSRHALAVSLVRTDAATLPEPPDLRSHLLTVAEFAVSRRHYLAPYVVDLATDAPRHEDDPLLSRITARAAGRIDEVDAATVLTLLLRGVLLRPDATPAELTEATLSSLSIEVVP